MRIYTVVLLIAAFTNLAQAATANSQAAAPEQSPARAPQSQTLVIPTGTRIPMSLASPIQVKSARPGAAVRAVTGFPVTVGSQLAIPAGTYVEGVIDKVVKHGRTGPTLQMHFTRILYSNGYSTAIDGTNVMARLKTSRGTEEGDAFAGESGDGNVLLAQSTVPTLPHNGPSVGTMVGVGIGVTAAAAVVGLLYLHHLGGGGAALVFDTGWQFEMVLQSPLHVDAASVAATSAGGR
jgi:type IV secretion system protein VirB10